MKVTDKGYYMDETLIENLDLLKKAVEKKWDGIIMIDGIEGSAKTTFAGAIAYYLNQDYGLDNVVFTQEQFFEAVDNSKPGQVIHWDEFVFGGLSTEALNKVQNALIKKMTTIRKKRLYILLLMPWFFMMRPYFAIGRSRCLIHTYTPDGITRGRFKFYSFINKQKLYHAGKKEYQYYIKPNFIGHFTDTFGMFFDEKEYEKKKDKAIESLSKEQDKKKDKYLATLGKAVILLKDTYKMSWSDVSRELKHPISTVRSWYVTVKNGIK